MELFIGDCRNNELYDLDSDQITGFFLLSHIPSGVTDDEVLENERNEHIGCFHVIGVRLTKSLQVVLLLHSARGIDRYT